jgi:hypothetical protein
VVASLLALSSGLVYVLYLVKQKSNKLGILLPRYTEKQPDESKERDINDVPLQKASALHWAAWKGQLVHRVLMEILLAEGIEVNVQAANGVSTLLGCLK